MHRCIVPPHVDVTQPLRAYTPSATPSRTRLGESLKPVRIAGDLLYQAGGCRWPSSALVGRASNTVRLHCYYL